MGRKPITGADRMWLCMRKMAHFTVADLEQLAEVKYGYAYKYLNLLHKAGYLKKESRRGGRGGVKWQLLKNTGPKPPMLQQIFVVKDQNTSECFTIQDSGPGGEPCGKSE